MIKKVNFGKNPILNQRIFLVRVIILYFCMPLNKLFKIYTFTNIPISEIPYKTIIIIIRFFQKKSRSRYYIITNKIITKRNGLCDNCVLEEYYNAFNLIVFGKTYTYTKEDLDHNLYIVYYLCPLAITRFIHFGPNIDR